MDNIVIVVIATLLIFSFIELLVGNYISRKRKKYGRIVSNEKIREQFSKARQDLMKLVASGELDPNSHTFNAFYKVHTFILRSPDRYDALGILLSDTFTSKSPTNSSSKLGEESKRWNKSMKRLALATGKGFAMIVDEFAPMLKLMPRLQAKLIILAANLPEQKPLKEISDAEKEMYALAAAT